MIKAAWLGRYDTTPQRNSFQRVVLSCDPAGKAGIHNDYTAITVIGIQQQAIHLLEVSRGHWTVMQMREQIIALAGRWTADLVIIEDTSSGMGLIQLLKEVSRLNVVGRRPDADKLTRMSRQQGRFEAGRILLPTEALWLADFESELLAFPSVMTTRSTRCCWPSSGMPKTNSIFARRSTASRFYSGWRTPFRGTPIHGLSSS